MSQDYETRDLPTILASIERSTEEQSQLLSRITDALETLAASTTQSPQVFNQYVQSETPSVSLEAHPGEVPAEDVDDEEYLYLADGRKVPKRCVDALDEYEATWPGASFAGARAALAWAVIAAYDESVKAAPVTEVLCLNDNPDIREKSSPCIRFTDHEGDHRDNTGGEWMQ
jgi:hypothetical protein